MRVYSEGFYKVENADFLVTLSAFSVSVEESEEQDYRDAYKCFCDHVREMLNEDKVMGFTTQIEDGVEVAFILCYPILATDDNYYNQLWEQNEDKTYRPYIEVEAG